jgi:abortive infection bacteriophage resistance protein
MPYSKPYLPVSDQVSLLVARGMRVDDSAKAERYLTRIGYYRLSAYWYLYRQPNGVRTRGDDFVSGADFEHVLNLYVFDRKMRLLALDAIERIEIACRTAIALIIGKRGANAHLVASNLDGRFTKHINRRHRKTAYAIWTEKLDKKFNDSKEDFANHFKSKYPGESPPIWIASELWDFGLLSHFLEGMKHADRVEVANMFNVAEPNVFCSWIRTLNFIRNLCAHHCRLWNHSLIDQPMMPKHGVMPMIDHLIGNTKSQERFYGGAVIIRYLLLQVSPDSDWAESFKSLVQTFPEDSILRLAHAGFTPSWDKESIWQ